MGAGFGSGQAVLFPICGYIGFLAMIGITFNFLSLQKKLALRKRVEAL
ncbi:hypothetical protein DOT_5839 [Desulfosporosinus sp. OT]|nr:hypothetical protein DOT_5839 [Desulfosporosinus sp. OT]